MKKIRCNSLIIVLVAVLIACNGCATLTKRAPSANPPKDAIVLFDGSDFSQWTMEKGEPVKWTLADGVMTIVPRSGSIVTKQNFGDFRMHLEFNVPDMPERYTGQGRGNSGIYIQKRYEVQILDSYGRKPEFNGCGSIYRSRTPDKNACKKPGEWQTYDIIFRQPRWEKVNDKFEKTENMRITVWLNGVLIHDNAEISDKTGVGSPEGTETGPIKLQDHGNEVKFRNIWIVPM